MQFLYHWTIRKMRHRRISALIALFAALGAGTAVFPRLAHSASGAENEVDRTLYESARTWVASRRQVPQEDVVVLPPDRRVQVPRCETNWQFDFPFAGAETVRARCAMPAGQLFLRIQFRQPVVAAAQRPPPSGPTARADDISGASSGNAAKTVLPAQVGRELSRATPAGFAPSTADRAGEAVYRMRNPARTGQTLGPQDVMTDSTAPGTSVDRAFRGSFPERFVLARDVSTGAILQVDDQLAMRTVVLARQALPRGARLAPELVTREERPASTGQASGAIADPAQLQDVELVRDVRVGEIIRTSDVRPALLVRRGETVVLSVGRASGLGIIAQLEALQDGRRGESVKLRNRESGRIVTGVVTGLNSAEGQ